MVGVRPHEGRARLPTVGVGSVSFAEEPALSLASSASWEDQLADIHLDKLTCPRSWRRLGPGVG
jgi:hypothetical protein